MGIKAVDPLYIVVEFSVQSANRIAQVLMHDLDWGSYEDPLPKEIEDLHSLLSEV